MVELRDVSQREIVIDESKFIYQTLEAEAESEVLNQVMTVSKDGKKVTFKPGSLILKTIEAGILGWENVKNAKGEVVPFKQELIKLLPKKIIDELYELISQSKLNAEELKNS